MLRETKYILFNDIILNYKCIYLQYSNTNLISPLLQTYISLLTSKGKFTISSPSLNCLPNVALFQVRQKAVPKKSFIFDH